MRSIGFFLLSIVFALPASAADRVQAEDLITGSGLENWSGNPALWTREGDEIVGRTTAEAPLTENTFLVWQGGTVGDFRLTLCYMVKNGNSGIQYRSTVLDADRWIVGGYQADILSTPDYTGILYEERGRGILVERGVRSEIDSGGNRDEARFAESANLQNDIHSDGWNAYVVEARGPKIRHYVNGRLMIEAVDNEAKHAQREGILALQLHQGPPMEVRFRAIRLEHIEPAAK